MALADECGDHTGDQPQSGDLVHACRNTKDGPLASPASQGTDEKLQPHLSNRSGSDHNSGAAFLTFSWSSSCRTCPTYAPHMSGICQGWPGHADPGHRGSDPLKLPELQGVQPPIIYLPFLY